MSDAATSAIAHLYRRAGFGITNTEAQSIAVNGYASAVDTLLNGAAPDPASNIPTPTPAPNPKAGAGPESIQERKARQQVRAQQRRDIALWWMQRMTASESPLREKMTLFWHGHFATSIDKVNEAAYMLSQNQIFRSMGLGTFEPMAQAVAKDPAMMIWLDANRNVKSSPNENFARVKRCARASMRDSGRRLIRPAITGHPRWGDVSCPRYWEFRWSCVLLCALSPNNSRDWLVRRAARIASRWKIGFE